MPIRKMILLVLFVCTTICAFARKHDDLYKCWKQQVQPLSEKYLAFSYKEQLNELFHSAEPWQTMHYTGDGMIWCSADNFLKQDTLINGKRKLNSKIQLGKTTLLALDYGEKKQSAFTQKLFFDKLLETARYTPVKLISYFADMKVPLDKESNNEFSVYTSTLNKTETRLYIRNDDKRLIKITTLENDDLRGDVQTVYKYIDYTSLNGVEYPQTIQIDKVNGKLKDTVRIDKAEQKSTATIFISSV